MDVVTYKVYGRWVMNHKVPNLEILNTGMGILKVHAKDETQWGKGGQLLVPFLQLYGNANNTFFLL